jgi:hypothetical protein
MTPELEQEPRLADPRLAEHEHRLTASAQRLREPVVQDSQLTLPAHEGGEPLLSLRLKAASDGPRALDAERADRAGLALDHELAERLEAEVGVH